MVVQAARLERQMIGALSLREREPPPKDPETASREWDENSGYPTDGVERCRRTGLPASVSAFSPSQVDTEEIARVLPSPSWQINKRQQA
jgi:hypothetical protein